MNISFSDKIPATGRGIVVDYYFRKNSHARWVDGDIKTCIREELSKWTEDIEDWHRALCVEGGRRISDWWFLQASRLISWHPPSYQPLVYARGLVRFCEQNQENDILVLNAPVEVAEYLSEFKGEWAVNAANLASSSTSAFATLKGWIKSVLSPALYFSKLFAKSFSNIFTKWPEKKEFKTLVYSHVVDANVLRVSGDHFYGNMFDQLPSFEDEDFLRIYLSSYKNPEGEKAALKEMNENGKLSLLVSEILTPVDLVAFFFRAMKSKIQILLFRHQVPLLKMGGYSSSTFSKRFYRDVVRDFIPFQELEIYYTMKKVFKKYKFQSIVYPFEDKGLERAILNVVPAGLKTVGFAHAVHSRGHLYLKERTGKGEMYLRPDVIACTGSAAADWLKRTGNIQQSELKVVGSKRFSEMVESAPKTEKLKVLFIVGVDIETCMMANFVEEHPGIFNGCQLAVKKYDFYMLPEQEAGFRRIQKALPSMIEHKTPLKEQIAWADAVIFGSTSAGIEAILAGRIGIQVDLHHLFSLDPLDDKVTSGVIFSCRTAEELAARLREIRSLSDSEYSERVLAQRNEALRIYSAPQADQIEKVLLH